MGGFQGNAIPHGQRCYRMRTLLPAFGAIWLASAAPAQAETVTDVHESPTSTAASEELAGRCSEVARAQGARLVRCIVLEHGEVITLFAIARRESGSWLRWRVSESITSGAGASLNDLTGREIRRWRIDGRVLVSVDFTHYHHDVDGDRSWGARERTLRVWEAGVRSVRLLGSIPIERLRQLSVWRNDGWYDTSGTIMRARVHFSPRFVRVVRVTGELDPERMGLHLWTDLPQVESPSRAGTSVPP